jgi:hypothetical protein
VTFTYAPATFRVGLAVTLLTILMLTIVALRDWRRLPTPGAR